MFIQGVRARLLRLKNRGRLFPFSQPHSASTSRSRRSAMRGGERKPLPGNSGITPRSAGCFNVMRPYFDSLA